MRYLLFFLCFLPMCLRAQLKLDPKFRAKAVVALEGQNLKSYLQQLDSLILLDNRDPNLYYQQALGYIALDKPDEASTSLLKALILVPNNTQLLIFYGSFLFYCEQYKEAIPLLEAALEQEMDEAQLSEVYQILASAYDDVEDWEASERMLRLHYELDSNDTYLLNNFGYFYLRTKRYPEALVLFNRAVQLDAKFALPYSNMGFIYQQMGEHKRALAFFDRCIELNESAEFSGLAYSNRGYSKLQLGQNKAALKDLNQSIKLFPRNGYAWCTRAEIYLTLKKKKKACENLQMALDLRYTEQWGDKALGLQRQHCK